MQIRTLEVAGFHSAIHAMRNPLDSWDKSDSVRGHVGPADRKLSMRLAKNGPEHAKHLRMIIVWADITAPLYWWKQFDTYRVGVEKLSCSTMHTLMKRPVKEEDFETDSISPQYLDMCLDAINSSIELYGMHKGGNDPEVTQIVWRSIIQMLPENYLQKRTVMMSYAAIRNMYHQRKGHKLKEWKQFREWAEGLPENWMITDEEPEADDDD